MNEIVKNRYFFQDELGRDAFFIHIEYEMGTDYGHMWTSLIVDLNKYFPYDEIELNIVKTIKNATHHMVYVVELAEYIKNEKSLYRLFLPECFLNKDGKFTEENAITIANILEENVGFADYTIFSDTFNFIHFIDFKVGLIAIQIQNRFIEIDIKQWLELINKHTNLQMEYIEHYSKDNVFYYYQKQDTSGCSFDYYMLFDCGELKLFFIRSTP
jgi:hypothetical protein